MNATVVRVACKTVKRAVGYARKGHISAAWGELAYLGALKFAAGCYGDEAARVRLETMYDRLYRFLKKPQAREGEVF